MSACSALPGDACTVRSARSSASVTRTWTDLVGGLRDLFLLPTGRAMCSPLGADGDRVAARVDRQALGAAPVHGLVAEVVGLGMGQHQDVLAG